MSAVSAAPPILSHNQPRTNRQDLATELFNETIAAMNTITPPSDILLPPRAPTQRHGDLAVEVAGSRPPIPVRRSSAGYGLGNSPVLGGEDEQLVGSPTDHITYPFSDTDDSADDLHHTTTSGTGGAGAGGGGSSATTSGPRRISFAEGVGNSASSRNAPPADVEYDSEGGEEEEPVIMNEAMEGLKNEAAVKSGYLKKKGEKRRTWKKRWFVLRPTRLAYYKNEKEYELLGIVHLKDIHMTAEVELKKRQNVFGLVTKQRTYYVQAASEQDMHEWVVALRAAMKEAQRERGSASPRERGNSISARNSVVGASSGDSSQRRHGSTTSDNGGPSGAGAKRPVSAVVVGSPSMVAAMPVEPQQQQRKLSATDRSRGTPGTRTPPDMALDVDDPTHSDQNSVATTTESFLTVATTPSMLFHGVHVGHVPLPGRDGASEGTPAAVSTPQQPTPSTLRSVEASSATASAPSLATSHTHNRSIATAPAAGNGSSSSGTSSSPSRPVGGASPTLVQSPTSSASPGPSSPSQRRTDNPNAASSSDEEEDEEDNDEVITKLKSEYRQRGVGSASSPSAAQQLVEQEQHRGQVLCQGYLEKQGTKYGQRWKKRWFVLRDSKLACYKDDGEYVVRRMIPLRNVLDIIEIDPVSKHHTHCFKIVLGKRQVVLSAPSAEEAAGWVEALRGVHES
ncbi:hypothetical protein HK104_002008, partial [Borealophlyctis nickersoniae]